MKIDIETLRNTKGIGNKTLERIIKTQKKLDNSNIIPYFNEEEKLDLNEDIYLIEGDMLKNIERIPDKSIDLVVTDPPYLHEKGGMKSKTYNTGVWNEDSYMLKCMSDFGKNEIFVLLDNIRRISKLMNAYIFSSKLQLQYYFQYILENPTLKYDLLVWDKINYSMKSTKFHTTDLEYIIRIYEPGVSLNKVMTEDNKKSDINYYLKRLSAKQPRGVHNTIKPVSILEKLIKVSSKENDIVLDCFMGSGSTGLAAVKNNRRFIGIEKNEEYFKIAEDNILKEYKKQNYFNIVD